MSEPLSSAMPTSTAAPAAAAAPASPLGSITIRPYRSHHDMILTNDADCSSSFGWADFPLITVSPQSASASSAAEASISELNADSLVVQRNDDFDERNRMFRPLSASRKMAALRCNTRNDSGIKLKDDHNDDDVSDTESRTSSCRSNDDDFDDDESDLQLVVCRKQKEECQRHVHFSTVSVREHAVTLGNHPYCNGAYPLTLDWPHTTTTTTTTSSSHGEYTIDEYEDQQKQKRACRRFSSSLQRVQDTGTSHQTAPRTFCQRTGEPIAIVHLLSPQEQKQQAARLRQTQLPFRLSALERRARLATVRGISFATLQEEEYQRRREEQTVQTLGGGGGRRGGGLVRTDSVNYLVYSSTSSLMRRQQFRLHSAANSTQVKFVGGINATTTTTTTASRATVVARPRDALFL